MIQGMTTIEMIIYIIVAVIYVAMTIILGIVGDKFSKEKKVSTNLVNYIDIIANLMPDLLNKYEQIFRNGKGDEKKSLVMNELTAYCIEHKIDYTTDILSNAIDNYCKVSKQINKGK